MAKEKELLMKIYLVDGNTLSFELYCGNDDVFSILPLYTDLVRQELINYYLNEYKDGIDKPSARVLADEKLKQLINKGINLNKGKVNRSISFIIDRPNRI